jgi:DNA-binding transcriptional LysR family regulator
MNEYDILFLSILNQEKSLTKAAEKLFISQPALSYRIKALEKELGVPLFNRSKTGINLTVQGDYLVEFASKLQLQLLKMKDEISSIASEEIRGTINLGTSLVFAHYELPMIIKQFHDIYPNIRFNVISGHSSKIFTMLNNQEVNVAIIRGDFKWHEDSFVLFTEPICIASEKEIVIEELPDLPRVKFKTDPILYHQINQWWNERFTSEPKVIIETSTTDTCLELIKVGMGYTIVPNMGLKNFNGHIQPIHWLNGEAFTRKTNLFMRSQANALPVIKYFSDFVLDYYHNVKSYYKSSNASQDDEID